MFKQHRMIFSILILVVFLTGCATTKVSLPGYNEPWLAVNKPDGTLSILEYLFGANNWVRINDAKDSLWSANSGANVRVVAEYSAHSQNLWAGSEDLFTISSGNFASLTTGATANINQAGTFSFLNKSGGKNWSSIFRENPDRRDHMVTFKITNHGGTNYSIGDYIVAWENLGRDGDYDYNDVVLRLHNITPIPEPATK